MPKRKAIEIPQALKDRLSKASKARSHESRVAGGRKAWQTQVANALAKAR